MDIIKTKRLLVKTNYMYVYLHSTNQFILTLFDLKWLEHWPLMFYITQNPFCDTHKCTLCEQSSNLIPNMICQWYCICNVHEPSGRDPILTLIDLKMTLKYLNVFKFVFYTQICLLLDISFNLIPNMSMIIHVVQNIFIILIIWGKRGRGLIC